MKQFATISATLALLAASPALADSQEKHQGHGHDTPPHTQPAVLAEIDKNNDSRIDFTEFSNHYETKHGWTAAQSAQEFVRLAGDDGTMDETALARVGMPESDLSMKGDVKGEVDVDMDVDMDIDTDADMKTQMDVVPAVKPTMVDSLEMTEYGRFSDYDADSDGRVTFAEYSKIRGEAGITTTAAAQEFMRATNGARDFDEAQFNTALNNGLFLRPTYETQMMLDE